MLDTERQFYADNLPTLLKEYRGRYIVVKGQSVLGPFATPDEAIGEGAKRFGLQPFLTRLVLEHQPEVSIPALTLGLLHANPPHTVRRAG